MRLLFLVLLLLYQNPVADYIGRHSGNNSGPAFGYSFQVSVDHTQCGSSTSSNFPIWIHINNVALKTVANGGLVNNSSGYDIVFSSDSAGNNLVPWEVEYYDGTNGVLNAWALGTCNNVSNYSFYMNLGNTAISSAQNVGSFAPAQVWANNFVMVQHFPNGTVLTSPTPDSTTNAYTCALTGATPPTVVAGQLDGGASFPGNTGYLDCGAQTPLTFNGNTVSAWIYPSATTTHLIADSYSAATGGISFRTNDSGGGVTKLHYEYIDSSGNDNLREVTASVTQNVWQYATATFDGTTILLYINGALAAMDSQVNSGTISSNYLNTADMAIGFRKVSGPAGQYWNGKLDEIVLAKTKRSADWILASYNNQNNPGDIVNAGFLIYSYLGLPNTPTITQTQTMITNYPQNQGDTNLYTGWSDSGRIVGTVNDGSGTVNPQNNLKIMQLTNYDPVTPANTTLSILNAMTGYGAIGATTTLTGETGAHSWKGYSPFYIGNKLYYNIYRQNTPAGTVFASGLITSADHGTDWCNFTTYTGNSNVCNSSVWSATGDTPTNVTALQWPAGANGTVTNKFAQWIPVQTCQGYDTNCPATTVNDTYIYVFAGWYDSGGLEGEGVHRCLKSADPMLVASWTHWDGSTWNSDYTLTANLGSHLYGMHGVMWSPEYGMFLGFVEDDNLRHTNVMMNSKDLIHWYPLNVIANPGINAEWFNPIIALRRVTGGGHVVYPFASDDNTPYAMIIQDVDFGIH